MGEIPAHRRSRNQSDAARQVGVGGDVRVRRARGPARPQLAHLRDSAAGRWAEPHQPGRVRRDCADGAAGSHARRAALAPTRDRDDVLLVRVPRLRRAQRHARRRRDAVGRRPVLARAVPRRLRDDRLARSAAHARPRRGPLARRSRRCARDHRARGGVRVSPGVGRGHRRLHLGGNEARVPDRRRCAACACRRRGRPDGRTSARTWLLLAGGLLVFGIGDVDFATLATTGQWKAGQVIDVAWAAGLLMLASAAWEPPAPEGVSTPRGLRRLVLAVPSAVVALALLVVGRGQISGAAIGLAGATLLCALVRMAHAVGLEGRLEATRAQAFTDDLARLGNRRLLVEDLDRVADERAAGLARCARGSSTSTASRATTTRSATSAGDGCFPSRRRTRAAVSARRSLPSRRRRVLHARHRRPARAGRAVAGARSRARRGARRRHCRLFLRRRVASARGSDLERGTRARRSPDVRAEGPATGARRGFDA